VHRGNGRFDAPRSLTSEDESRPMAAATVAAALAGHAPEDELARTLYDMRNQSLGILQANIGRRSEVTVKCSEQPKWWTEAE
jgi:hypothetical protein